MNQSTLSLPTVSIIMPIYNEERYIHESLSAVLAQDYPADKVEILIADGMSNDGTRTIIEMMNTDGRIRILDNPERRQSFGLNRLIEAARHDYLIRVDGHTILAPNYISKCVEHLQTSGASNVGGAMNPVGRTRMGYAIAAAGKSAFAVPSAFHVSNRAQFTDTVYLGAWHRTIFDEVGGFNTQVGVNEDYELNYRIRQAGHRVYFCPDIQSTYYGRQTVQDLWKQYLTYGRSKVRTLRQHPQSIKLRHLVAPLFVLWMGLGVVALALPIARWAWLAVMACYVLLCGVFAWRASHKREVSMWRVALVFPIVHLAWGIGFWAEWLFPHAKFAPRKP